MQQPCPRMLQQAQAGAADRHVACKGLPQAGQQTGQWEHLTAFRLHGASKHASPYSDLN